MRLEFIVSLLIKLTEEVNKINEILPKILDIKSEVTNTADTVRNMRVDLINTTSMIEMKILI